MCIASVLTLSGCWESDYSLLPQNALSTPPFAGEFRLVDAEDKGEAENWRATVRGKVAHIESYSSDSGWKADSSMRFVRQNEDIFLAERIMDEPGSSVSFLFAVVADDGSVSFVAPVCTDELVDSGLAYRPNSECAFESYDNLRAAARDYVDRFVRGRAQADDIWYLEPD